MGLHLLHGRLAVDGHDLPLAGAQVAEHLSEVIRGNQDVDLHDRLQQHRPGLAAGAVETQRSRGLEGQRRGGGRAIHPVAQDDFDVDRRIPVVDARRERAADSTLYRLGELPRQAIEAEGVDEAISLAPFPRANHESDVRQVLFAPDHFVIALSVGRFPGDGFPVGDLGRADSRMHLEVLDDPGHQDIQVQLPHARDDQLSGLLVLPDSEGRILPFQLPQGSFELRPLGESSGFDRHGDHGLGEVHGLQHDREVLAADRVAGLGNLEADRHRDVSGRDLLQWFVAVGVHAQKPMNALPLFLVHVVRHRPAAKPARVHPDEAQVAGLAVELDLVDQAQGLAVELHGDLQVLFLLHVVARGGKDLIGRREKIHDGIEEGLYAHVLE